MAMAITVNNHHVDYDNMQNLQYACRWLLALDSVTVNYVIDIL